MSDDRREADLAWKASVDEKLKEGQATFEGLIRGQAQVLKELANNTQETRQIGRKLDEHVDKYEEFSQKMNPIAEAMETMKPGVLFFGQVGKGLAWLGRKLRWIIIWFAPFAAAATAYWQYVEHFGAGKK